MDVEREAVERLDGGGRAFEAREERRETGGGAGEHGRKVWEWVAAVEREDGQPAVV